MIRALVYSLALFFLIIGCASPTQTAGGTSDTGNPVILACAVTEDGLPVQGALVRFRPAAYIPGFAAGSGRDTTTGETGIVEIHVDTGAVTIEIIDTLNGVGILLRDTLTATDSARDYGRVVLLKTGTLRGKLATESSDAFVAIRGLERALSIGAADSFTLDNIPEGTYSVYVKDESQQAESELDSIPVSKATTTYLTDINPSNASYRLIAPGTFSHDSLLLRTFMVNQGIADSLFDIIANIDSATRRIRTLRLQSLGITDIHESVAAMDFIWRLYLDHNPLTAFPEPVTNMTRLIGLSLSGVTLDSIPQSFGRCISLEWLRLDSTGITELPETLAELPHLKQLDCRRNGLTDVPAVIYSCASLEVLRLHQNFLTSLDSSIGNLVRLRILSLDANRLTALPGQIGECTNLEELYLFQNQLDTLPESIGQLTSLKILHLESNVLKSLPSTIGNLSAITHLYLGDNAFSTLPESITGLAPVMVQVYGNSLCEQELSQSLILWLDTYNHENYGGKKGPIWRSLQKGCL
jgi:Leucine-rich repeat (LRR) protein